MPVIGILELIAIACAVHVVRTGRPYYWIYMLIGMPGIGTVVYFFAEIMPELMQTRTARQTAAGVARAINPGKGMREALRRVEITPTAENKAFLAEQYLLAGRAAEAAALYRDALVGVHATDPGMMLGLARALFAQGDTAETEIVLDKLREANPDYNTPDGHLLYIRSLEDQGKIAAALEEYRALTVYYPGQEARCRYAMLLLRSGRADEARRMFGEICQLIEYGPRYQRRAQRAWHDIARRSLAGN
jgi:hypothetical protein